MDLPNTRLWRDDPRPMASSPLIVVPTDIKPAVVLEAVKVWPGKAGARRKVGATANLDSSCARRLCNTAGRGEETGFPRRTKKLTRKQEREIAALKSLDNKSPIQGLLGVHSRYGLHTRAVTVYRDTLSEGFSHFVTSIAAPVASGWSVCRVGLAPTGKRRLFTAHAQVGHFPFGSSLRTARRGLVLMEQLTGPFGPFRVAGPRFPEQLLRCVSR